MDAGIGEAALISAAIGAGTGAAGSSLAGGDPLKGALRGALMGGVTGGIGAGIGGLGSAASTAAEVAPTVAEGTTLGSAGAQGLDQASLDFVKANPQLYPTAPDGSLASSVSMTPSSYNPTPQVLTGSGTGSAGLVDYGGMTPQQALDASRGVSSTAPLDASRGVSSTAPTVTANNPVSPASKGLLDFGYKGTPTNAFGYGPQSNLGLAGIGIGSGLTAAMQAERDKYAPPGLTPYTGILSKYDPYTAKGVQYPTQYSEGGIAALAMGGQPNQMYPMSQQEHTNFMDPTQLPANAMEVRNYEPATNPMTGNMTRPMASGGITSLGSYSDGGRLLKGPGDGMSDNIPATIADKQPARLADGEFVVPADVVSHLGNGSTDAGAKNLYKMMDKVRKARTGNPKQGRQINPNKYIPA
jgi:hypothetical protein